MRGPVTSKSAWVQYRNVEVLVRTLPAFLHSLRTEVGKGLLIPNGMSMFARMIQIRKKLKNVDPTQTPTESS